MAVNRKILSIVRLITIRLRSFFFKIKSQFFMEGVSLGEVSIHGANIFVSCTDGGKIIFGKNVSINSNVKIIAQGGVIKIGDNSFIGDGVLIVSKETINIGKNALIAEYVVIRDQNHGMLSDPMNQAGFTTSPISIEENVWLGCKATILKGVQIGRGAVVSAHALVNKNVPDRAIVAGVPAVQIKQR